MHYETSKKKKKISLIKSFIIKNDCTTYIYIYIYIYIDEKYLHVKKDNLEI